MDSNRCEGYEQGKQERNWDPWEVSRTHWSSITQVILRGKVQKGYISRFHESFLYFQIKCPVWWHAAERTFQLQSPSRKAHELTLLCHHLPDQKWIFLPITNLVWGYSNVIFLKGFNFLHVFCFKYRVSSYNFTVIMGIPSKAFPVEVYCTNFCNIQKRYIM